MATIVKKPHNKTDGTCSHCGWAQCDGTRIGEESSTPIDGYVINVEFNCGEPYAYYGRCYYCNHRDRG